MFGVHMAPDTDFAADVCSTLQTALEVVQSSRDTSAVAPPRELVAATAEGLKQEAAKVGLMYSDTRNAPSGNAAQALLGDLRDNTTALCMLYAAAAASGSTSLRKSLEATAAAVVGAVCDLVQAAAGKEGPSELVVRCAGMCIERCTAAAKAPLDDRTAIGRALASVARQLADAANEVGEEQGSTDGEDDEGENGAKEAEEDQQQEEEAVLQRVVLTVPAPAEAEGGARATARNFAQKVEEWLEGGDAPEGTAMVGTCTIEGGRVLASLLVGGPGAMPVGSAVALRDAEADVEEGKGPMTVSSAVLLAVQSVLQGAAGVVQAAMRALMAAEGASQDADAWESVLFHARQLAVAADDLAAAAYPPHDAEEVGGALEAVVNSCELIGEEAPGGLAAGMVSDVELTGKQLVRVLRVVEG